MYSLYPSFVACLCLLAFTCMPIGAACIEQLGVGTFGYWIFSGSYMCTVLLHFLRPAWNWFWLPAVVFFLYHILRQSKLRPSAVVQVILIGAAAQAVAEYILAWYPYPNWKGIPLYLLFSVVWCAVSLVFHGSVKLAMIQVTGICVVGCIREFMHGRVLPGNIMAMELRDGTLLCNVLWMSFCLLVAAALCVRLWNNSKMRHFRVI